MDQCAGVNIGSSLRTLLVAGEMAGLGMLTAPWASVNLGKFALIFIVDAFSEY